MCHPEVPEGQPTPQVTTQEVGIPVGGGETMPALLALPEGGGPAPAVLVACDVFGRSPFYEGLAARLATAGFEALVPEFFFRQGPLAQRTREAAFARRERLNQQRSLEDLRAALAWLRERPGHAGRIGTVGFCMGGTFVLDLAALEPGLVTVCYYGFPAGPNQPSPTPPPRPLDLADRMTGPILGFWGDQDAGCGMDNVAELASRLAARTEGVSFDHRVYPGLGHGFMAASNLDPSSDAYEAACESWTMALELWRQHLGAPAPA
jgi:carboxymethylenebutenolidase